MKNLIIYQLAGMTEEMRKEHERYVKDSQESDSLIGYIPEDLEIWVPPKPIKVEGFKDSIDYVFLEGEGKAASIYFLVPKDWVTKRISGWKTRLGEVGWSKTNSTANLLDQFIMLSEAPPEQYLSFAQKWGPLWEKISFNGKIPEEFLLAPWIESVEIWRMHARSAKAVLDIASYLNQDPPKFTPLNIWERLFFKDKAYQSYFKNNKRFSASIDISRFDTIEKQREELAIYINVKMLKHHVKFNIDWQRKKPELKIGSTLGFHSAVWFQLLQAITKQLVCLCSGCGMMYVRTGRKPAKGRNNYCESCGVNAAKRDWARRG